MNRALNELKSRAINRTGFIGIVINTPGASRGVGSGIVLCTPQPPATEKGKAILRQGTVCPLTPPPSITMWQRLHAFRDVSRGGETRNRAIWRGPQEPEVPQRPTRQLHRLRGVARGKGEAGPGISRTQLDLPGWSILGAPGRGSFPPS